MDEPLIISFQTQKGNNYIYDAATNMIFFSTECMQDIICNFKNKSGEEIVKSLSDKYPEDEVEKSYIRVKNLVDKYNAFFPEESNDQANLYFSKNYIKQKISNIKQLILNVTENCNFRCKYCVFSDHYEFWRNHSFQTMTFEIAKNSIDYFFSLLISEKRIRKICKANISFYGGEPLIEFNLIKKCVEYAKIRKIEIEDEIRFNVTTNGSLLSGSILDYLIENSFIVAISLDGPQSIHDKYRIFKNGKGSFGKIWQNIKYIKKNYPDFYRNNIIFLCTYSPLNAELSRIEKFFRNSFFSKIPIRAFPIDQRNTTFIKNKKITKYFKKDCERLFDIYCDALKKNKEKVTSPFIRSLFTYQFKNIMRQKYSPLHLKNKFTGVCLPGEGKIFVSTNGDFHVCEKINHHFPIGNYKKGIDYQKINKLYSDYFNQLAMNCSKCIAVHFCNICFVSVAEDGKFKSKEVCGSIREILPKNLSKFFSILEENRRAFDDFDFEMTNFT